MKIGTLALAAALCAPALTAAQTLKPVEVVFQPTRAGAQLNAQGSVMLEELARGLEIFTVSVSASVENRDNLRIEVRTKGGDIELGALRMLLGRGTREVWSSIEPSKIFPLRSIYQVVISRGKTALLVADIPR